MVFLPVAGFGSVTNPLCNTVTSADYCPDCHKVDVRHYHCKNWECPVCYPWTAARAGKRAADRLNGAFWAWRSIGKEKQLKTCLRCSGQMYQVPVWSERQLIEMKAGEYRYIVDEDSIRSRLVTVHNYYTVRTSQALIDKSLGCSPPVC